MLQALSDGFFYSGVLTFVASIVGLVTGRLSYRVYLKLDIAGYSLLTGFAVLGLPGPLHIATAGLSVGMLIYTIRELRNHDDDDKRPRRRRRKIRVRVPKLSLPRLLRPVGAGA